MRGWLQDVRLGLHALGRRLSAVRPTDPLAVTAAAFRLFAAAGAAARFVPARPAARIDPMAAARAE